MSPSSPLTPSRRGGLAPHYSLRSSAGFTLIEVLLVIAILSGILAIVVNTINVRETFLKGYDRERVHEAKQIENAAYQYLVSEWKFPNGDSVPVGKEHAKDICRDGVSDSSCIVLNPPLPPTYLAAIPQDPAFTNDPILSGYKIYQENGRITVVAVHLGQVPGEVQQQEWVTNGVVRAVVRTGGTTYISGAFTQVSPAGGGAAHVRNRLAAFDANGALLPWNPDVSGWSIDTMAAQGSLIYVGGNFSSIGGQPRNNIAAIDATTGIPSSWNPNAGGSIYTVTPSPDGTVIYVGGIFSTIGGAPRMSLAALDAMTGNATSWNPQGDGEVTDIAFSPDDSIVYVAGQFTSMGGQSRSNLAALSAASATATAWNPSADDQVIEIEVAGTTAYVSGGFTMIGGQPRNYFAAVDTTTGAPTGWNPNADSNAYALTVQGSTVYVGGSFTNIGGQPRNNIAALDATTGNATSWNPNANNGVESLVIDGGSAYVGGLFTTINGLPRAKFARIAAP